ncbi:MAG: UvrD-helicase domain-containing protein, partial [Clostridia bacterium]|nr:UvrD-helicase domain-containing protein [Clostridia bacterium]
MLKKIVKQALDDGDAKMADSFGECISNIKNNAPDLVESDLLVQSETDEYLIAVLEDLQKATQAEDTETLVNVIQEYNRRMAENNALDFDDLLYYVHKIFSTNPQILQKYRERYQFVLIDEFQDVNKVQYQIFKMLASEHGNIFVVGDDDQSIYSWRGADPLNFKKFEQDFPTCKIFKLEQNYRSTKAILKVANDIIASNSNRYEKVLFTDNSQGVKPQIYSASDEMVEANYVCEQIRNLRYLGNYRFKDFAILMRINALSRAFEQELLRYRIPYKVFGGFKFFERKEIKDVLAYLRLINNPADSEAFFRAINVPVKRGIGDTTLSKLAGLSADYGMSIIDVISDERNLEIFNKTIRAKLLDFYKLIDEMMQLAKSTTVAKFVHILLDVLEVRKVYTDMDDEDRALNIDQFEQSVIDFQNSDPGATLADYLQTVSLSADIDEANNGDYVTIATIHAVKGLEFKTVFVVGLEDGIFPTSRATYSQLGMQEERRLMYVAVTRAEERLYLTRANSRFMYGQRKNTLASRYFSEVKQMLTPVRPPSTERQLSDDSYLDKLNLQPTQKPINTGKTTSQIKQFKVGQMVEHATFGKGMILRMAGDIADVIFESVGKKSLNIRFAPLKILQ